MRRIVQSEYTSMLHYSTFANTAREMQEVMNAHDARVTTLTTKVANHEHIIRSMVPALHSLSANDAAFSALNSFIVEKYYPALKNGETAARELCQQQQQVQRIAEAMRSPCYEKDLNDELMREQLGPEDDRLIAEAKQNLHHIGFEGSDIAMFETRVKQIITPAAIVWPSLDTIPHTVGSICFVDKPEDMYRRTPSGVSGDQAVLLAETTRSDGTPVYVVCCTVGHGNGRHGVAYEPRVEYRVVAKENVRGYIVNTTQARDVLINAAKAMKTEDCIRSTIGVKRFDPVECMVRPSYVQAESIVTIPLESSTGRGHNMTWYASAIVLICTERPDIGRECVVCYLTEDGDVVYNLVAEGRLCGPPKNGNCRW